VSVRDHIRGDLLDAGMLNHLEGCGSINSIPSSTWQCQAVSAGTVANEGVASGGVASRVQSEWMSADHLSQYLEVSGNALVGTLVGVAH
jgi:hypothetical protein